MATTMQNPAFMATTTNAPRTKTMVYRIATGLFCLQMSFTAFAQLRVPAVAAAFAHYGFPDYFRVELAWTKVLGILLLLAPVPSRLKEWAYAGFAINIGSAFVVHYAMGEGLAAWMPAVGTSVVWGLSYYFWRRLESTRASD